MKGQGSQTQPPPEPRPKQGPEPKPKQGPEPAARGGKLRARGTATRRGRAATREEVRNFKRIVSKGRMFMGIDLHRDTLQIAVVDEDGKILSEAKIVNDFATIREFFSKISKEKTKCVVESSSVWYGVYRLIEGMGYDIILSNPLQTFLIAKSKNKNDKVDARKLAELLRINSISECYVPDEKTVREREAVLHRVRISRARAQQKRFVRAILLQKSDRIRAQSWSPRFVSELRKIDDWRIKDHLGTISHLDDQFVRAELMIKDMVVDNPAAQLLGSIPGIGNLTSLAAAAWIGPIDRFKSPYELSAYFGVTPSERSSAEIVRYGHITKAGSPTVRWLLSEAVLTHVTHVDSDISRFYLRLRKEMPAKKALMATVSKLLRIIFWMLKKNLTFVNCMAEGGAEFKGCVRRKAALKREAEEGA